MLPWRNRTSCRSKTLVQKTRQKIHIFFHQTLLTTKQNFFSPKKKKRSRGGYIWTLVVMCVFPLMPTGNQTVEVFLFLSTTYLQCLKIQGLNCKRGAKQAPEFCTLGADFKNNQTTKQVNNFYLDQ